MKLGIIESRSFEDYEFAVAQLHELIQQEKSTLIVKGKGLFFCLYSKKEWPCPLFIEIVKVQYYFRSKF